MEGVFQLFGKGVGLFGNRAIAHFLTFVVLAPVAVWFSLLMCYSEGILRLKGK